MDYENDDYLDTSWIDDVRRSEQEYDKYYVKDQTRVTIFFLLVKDGVLSETNRVVVRTGVPNVLTWADIYPYVGRYADDGYIMKSKLRYVMDASPEDIVEGTWCPSSEWTAIEPSSDVYFGNIVEFMHDISCVACVMVHKNDRSPKRNGTSANTRRVYMGAGANDRRGTRKNKNN